MQVRYTSITKLQQVNKIVIKMLNKHEKKETLL